MSMLIKSGDEARKALEAGNEGDARTFLAKKQKAHAETVFISDR